MVKKFLLITLLILSLPIITKAEDFTDASRFTWWVYTNTNTEVASGTGLISNSYQNINHIQWLYNSYTYSNQYLYDISLKIQMFHFPAQDLTDLAQSCEIYPNTGPHYSCYIGKEYIGNDAYLTISTYNVQGNGQSNLWLNVYWANNTTLHLDISKYTLTINRKENTNVSSQDIANQTQTIINNNNYNTNQIIQGQNDINYSINDDTPVSNNDLDDTLSDWNDNLSDENALSDFILMPFTILNNISNGLGARCETFNLGSLLGHNIVLPCINIQHYVGVDLWSTIDSLFCLFMIYNIAMLFIQAFEGITTLRDDFDSLYTPQHGDFGYRPRHGSE